MALIRSLNTAVSGLKAQQFRIEVIGNNIANVNTVAFKSNRLILAPTFSRNFSLGTAPTANTGETAAGLSWMCPIAVSPAR